MTQHNPNSEATAVTISILAKNQSEALSSDLINELNFLAKTSDIEVVKNFTQKIDKTNSKTLIGKGKIEEISSYIIDNNIQVLIFDCDLSASQFKNLSEILPKNTQVLDKSNLILDIFAKHAKTSQAKTQVELAQYQYLLPRLKRMWTHLERQKGGIGMRGPGETKLETDRRIILKKIALLKEKLKHIDLQNAQQRKNRTEMVRVALVGYTNVGKSTLMNTLTDANVLAENKLFATLDTIVRKIKIKDIEFLISDTIGFIRNLPHHLIESFKATLHEVKEADIILHVVDISNDLFEEQANTVYETLKSLNAINKPIITIFNKIDVHTNNVVNIENTWMAKQSICISAENKTNIDKLKELLYTEIRTIQNSKYP
ncbi:MAG: GTPase HflX [Solitalea-like symbiont of Acarus siro]